MDKQTIIFSLILALIFVGALIMIARKNKKELMGNKISQEFIDKIDNLKKIF